MHSRQRGQKLDIPSGKHSAMADAAPAPPPARPAEPERSSEATPLSEVWTKDCRVRQVAVQGASRTKDYVVLREMEPVRACAGACSSAQAWECNLGR